MGKINFLKYAALFCAVSMQLALSACVSKPEMNSELETPYQTVSVTTPGQEGAHCFMQTGSRSYSVSTPARVNIHKNAEPMQVTCFKGEHMIGTQNVTPTLAPKEASTGENCTTCQYPGSIVVAMGLNPQSFAVNVTQIK